MLQKLQILGAILAAVFIATQILWPMWQGTLFFPTFRPKQRRLERELRATREEVVTADLEETLEHEREQLAGRPRRRPGKRVPPQPPSE